MWLSISPNWASVWFTARSIYCWEPPACQSAWIPSSMAVGRKSSTPDSHSGGGVCSFMRCPGPLAAVHDGLRARPCSVLRRSGRLESAVDPCRQSSTVCLRELLCSFDVDDLGPMVGSHLASQHVLHDCRDFV